MPVPEVRLHYSRTALQPMRRERRKHMRSFTADYQLCSTFSHGRYTCVINTTLALLTSFIAHCEAIKQHGWQPPQRILNMHSMDEIILGIRIAWTEGTGRPLQQDLEIQRPFETHYLAALDKFPDNTFDTSCANLTGRETEPEQITHAILTCRCFHILRQLGGMKTNLEGYMSENQNTTALLNLQLMQRLLCHFLELVQTDMDYIRSATRPGSTLHDVTIAYACAGLLYSKFANFKNNLKKEPYKACSLTFCSRVY